MSGRRPQPAQLQTPVAVETPWGGRVTTWLDTAVVWLTLGPPTRRTLSPGEGAPETLETAVAEAREDLRVVPGGRLVVAGEAPWTVTAVDRSDDGRMKISLER